MNHPGVPLPGRYCGITVYSLIRIISRGWAGEERCRLWRTNRRRRSNLPSNPVLFILFAKYYLHIPYPPSLPPTLPLCHLFPSVSHSCFESRPHLFSEKIQKKEGSCWALSLAPAAAACADSIPSALLSTLHSPREQHLPGSLVQQLPCVTGGCHPVKVMSFNWDTWPQLHPKVN